MGKFWGWAPALIVFGKFWSISALFFSFIKWQVAQEGLGIISLLYGHLLRAWQVSWRMTMSRIPWKASIVLLKVGFPMVILKLVLACMFVLEHAWQLCQSKATMWERLTGWEKLFVFTRWAVLPLWDSTDRLLSSTSLRLTSRKPQGSFSLMVQEYHGHRF